MSMDFHVFLVQIYNKYLQEVGDTVQVGQTQTLSLPEWMGGKNVLFLCVLLKL